MSLRYVRQYWDHWRFHLAVDTDAHEHNAIVVDVPDVAPCVILQSPAGETMPELWRQALSDLKRLRAQIADRPRLHPDLVDPPFATLIVTSRQRCADDTEEMVQWMLAAGSHDHDERVRALCNLHDLYERQLAGVTEPPSAGQAAH